MFESVLMIAAVVVAVLLLIVILLQRSDGGMGSLAGGSSAAFSSSGGGDTLARMTAILAIIFVGISLTLAVQNGGKSRPQSVVEGTEAAPVMPAAEAEKLQEMEVPAVPATLPVSKEMK